MFLQAQLKSPVHGDWGQTCYKDLEELDISLTINDIERMSEQSFRRLVKEKTDLQALDYLNHLKAKHSKVMNVDHQNLNMQAYLEPNEISVQESKFMFALRRRMVDVRANYREQYFVASFPS